jgi:hypothetical protein
MHRQHFENAHESSRTADMRHSTSQVLHFHAMQPAALFKQTLEYLFANCVYTTYLQASLCASLLTHHAKQYSCTAALLRVS